MADLLAFMMFSADARQADEGRSFFSKKGGGNRVGEQIVGEKVRIYSDPAHPLAPSDARSTTRGCRSAANVWIEKGVLKDLFYSRFWAQKMGKKPTAGPANLIMDGGTATMADLIAGTERGVLVTRFWYIRLARSADDPRHRTDARRPVPDRKGQGHAAGEEHALERESRRRPEQPRRDDAAGARGQRRRDRRRRLVARLPGGPHPRVHVLELVRRGLASRYDFLTSSSSRSRVGST